MTIPETLEYLRTKCEALPDNDWMACKVFPALKFIFSLLQERLKTPVDIEVVAFCAAMSRLKRYLRTAVSEKSVFELTRSRQVAETHHVIYAELDRLLDMLEISETDSIRVWRSDEGPVTQNTVVTSSTLHRHGTGGDTSSGDAVVLNHFDAPFADHASWTKAGLAALDTPPSWVLPLRELLFSESNLIGQGSFGNVYKGSWLDTPVVVKFMGYEEDPNTISTDLLLHEVRVWYRLNHPHVLKLYGANHVDKRYFVCEFAPNGELRKYLSKPGNEHLMWEKMYETALGLQYLHGQNVAHNDLKCDNIMVGMDGKAKLIDFGLSCLLNEAEIQIDVKKMGAVHWKSPEYLAGGRPSFASDVYSFAMCIIEVVSGDIPWGKMIPAAVRFQVLRRNNIPNLPESMSEKQRNLIKLMMKKEPSERVRMAFVVEKLREFAQDEMANFTSSLSINL